ncbi:MAG: 50S ribosomal protein L11 methyltransferase [Desulfobacterales bacterium]
MPQLTDLVKKGTEGALSESIRARIRAFLSGRRRTPADILLHLSQELPVSRVSVQAAIRELVADGELAYTHEHGRTFLEPSFDRAVRVGRRLVLAPPDRAGSSENDDLVIRIRPGVSFGAGRHPTTRLALRAIEAAVIGTRRPAGGVLDIGTGSGVLAIAAVKLGLAGGIGLDIDPCALAEARENVRLNGFEGRIEISDQGLESIDRSFTLVAANLRLPTLVNLASRIELLTESHGALVVSGIRTEERSEIEAAYGKRGFSSVWSAEEYDWAGTLMRKM